jgi:uroporphyrinogen-III synthase
MRILYLGTDPSRFVHKGELVHYPVIRTVPLQYCDSKIEDCTHWLFTSPNAVRHWFQLVEGKPGRYLAVGPSTAVALSEVGVNALVAPHASQEGMIALLDTLDLHNAFFGWPRSSRARPLLAEYLTKQRIRFMPIDLYETVTQALEPKPNLCDFDEIVFTSPSTVDAFLEIFGPIPREKKITPIGPITAKRLSVSV